MPYIDLTHPFTSEPPMPVYPGDPAPQMRAVADVASHGFSDTELTSTLHVGTHIDAPAHMISGGKLLSAFPVEYFFGRGFVVDARGRQRIDADALDSVPVTRGDILLVRTGHDVHFRTPAYFDSFPECTLAFAERVLALGVRMVGMDTPSPDRAPFPVHKQLLARDILIMENLTGLSALIDHTPCEIIALPMRLACDAAPARVVAKVDARAGTTGYTKLVRDKIPQIIVESGVSPQTHIADDQEYWQKLKEKLREETEEFFADERAEELADVLEVVYALGDAQGVPRDALERVRQEKASARGGFTQKIILDETR